MQCIDRIDFFVKSLLVTLLCLTIVLGYSAGAIEGFGQVKIENGQKEEGEEYLSKARKTYLELGIESN